MKTTEFALKALEFAVTDDERLGVLKRFQLDAFKAGMTHAAELEISANSTGHDSICGCMICIYRRAIVVARKNLNKLP